MWFKHIIEVLFSLALFLNAVLFIPQAVRIYQQRSAKDVSLLMFLGFCFIQLITIIHGYIKKDYILMSGFSISLLTCAIVTFLIFLYRKI